MSEFVPTGPLDQAVKMALSAPSVHNTQPWRWRIADETVELHADWLRHLVATDPGRRDLLISCGAALHHLRVALAGLGRAVWMQRFPDEENSGHLATVGIAPGLPDPVDVVLARSVPRRRTDRRRFSSRPVTATDLDLLARRAEAAGCVLHPMTDERIQQLLASTLEDAARYQQHTPGYQA